MNTVNGSKILNIALGKLSSIPNDCKLGAESENAIQFSRKTIFEQKIKYEKA